MFPVSAVFLAIFICCAAGHMTILQINNRRGHKFLMSGMMFGCCMARITTMVMRIVWACRPNNIRIAIAAQIFVTAGVILLFVVNMIFAQRLLRAAHPHFGWHKTISITLKVLYALIVVLLITIITVTVQSFYTLNHNTKRIDRDIQLTVQTYYDVFSFLPLPMVVLTLLIPRETHVEKFGTGRWRSKVRILLTATLILCLGATFRLGTNFKTPRPKNDPAWYQSKACFWIFNFTLEVIVIVLYLVVRVDRRFHVPNNSHGPGDYSRNILEKQGSGRGVIRVNSEEEVFDDEMPEEHKDDVEAAVHSHHPTQ